MFKNVGTRLKLSAWIVFGIGSIASIVIAIICFTTAHSINSLYSDLMGFGMRQSSGAGGGLVAAGILILLFGIFLSYVLALMVWGFGSIVKDTQKLAGDTNENKEPQSLKEEFAEAFSSVRPAQPKAPKGYGQPGYDPRMNYGQPNAPQQPYGQPQGYGQAPQNYYQPQQAPFVPQPEPQPASDVQPQAPKFEPAAPAPEMNVVPEEAPVEETPVIIPEEPVVAEEVVDEVQIPEVAEEVKEQSEEIQEEITDAVEEKAEEAPALEEDGKICPNCGTKNDLKYAFCKQCGNKL